MFDPPKNQRLPREVYRDSSRITFFTIRATEDSSPFARVNWDSDGTPTIEFNHPLCAKSLDVLFETKEKLGCDVVIACLMPDHLHLLARPRTLASDVLTLMDRFKGKATNESWQFGHAGRLWQPRSYDHVLRHDAAIHAVAEYIAHNPVRKRYVVRWEDWPYTVRWDAGIVV